MFTSVLQASTDTPNPLRLQHLFDHDGAGHVIYEGWALPGKATSAAAWEIVKRSWTDANENSRQYAEGAGYSAVWDNRASATYK